MTQWSHFKRNHGYNQDPYWYGERPNGLTLKRIFLCLSCVLGGFGQFRRERAGKRGGKRKYYYRDDDDEDFRFLGGGGGRGGAGDLAYRDDMLMRRMVLGRTTSRQHSIYYS